MLCGVPCYLARPVFWPGRCGRREVSCTPAAEFARVKVAFPDWSIRRVQPGKGAGFTARRRPARGGSQALYCRTLGELEHVLWQADSSGEHR